MLKTSKIAGFRPLFSSFFAFAVATSLVACGGAPAPKKTPQPQTETPTTQTVQDIAKAADRDIQKSISASKDSLDALVISKNALGKEFLFNSVVFDLTGRIETFAVLLQNPRIVTFEQKENYIVMFDATNDNNVISNLNQKIILARFPIIKHSNTEDPTKVAFEFNNSISKIISLNDDATANTNHLQNPIVDRIENSGSETLRIVQNANIRYGKVDSPIEIQYLIAPYKPDPTYKPMTEVLDGKRHFKVNTAKTSDRDIQTKFIARHHTDHPITITISQTVPTKYRESIRTGITYWNKAFEHEKIKVIDPGFDSNAKVSASLNGLTVEWLETSNAAAAWAQSMSDPRTGQIIAGNIYIPRNFTELISLQTIANTLKKSQINKEKDAKAVFENEAKNELVNVSAHEFGHLLGILHNFAGSLASPLDLNKLNEVYENEILNKNIDKDIIVTSTVMDYLPYKTVHTLSEQIKNQSKALPYDQAAVKALYKNDFEQISKMDFCTNGDESKYVDCDTWDIGNYNPLQNENQFKAILESIRLSRIDTIINYKNKEVNTSGAPITERTANEKFVQENADSILSVQRKTYLLLLNENRKTFLSSRNDNTGEPSKHSVLDRWHQK